MARAEDIYVDPSALMRLYVHQAGSQEMCAWRAKTPGPLEVTHHGRTEIVNAICRVAFLGRLQPGPMEDALTQFEIDFAEGRLQQADLLWRAALNKAGELSRKHTPTIGTRALDVLHVACALELRLKRFLTFDKNQGALAAKVGLKVVTL